MKRITSITLILVALFALVGCQIVAPMPSSGKVAGITVSADTPTDGTQVTFNKALARGAVLAPITDTAHIVRAFAVGITSQVMWDGVNSTFSTVSENSGDCLLPIKGFESTNSGYFAPRDIELFNGGSLFEAQPLVIDEFPMDPEKGYKIFTSTTQILYFEIVIADPVDPISPARQQTFVVSAYPSLADLEDALNSRGSLILWADAPTISYAQITSGQNDIVNNVLDVPWDNPDIAHVYYFKFNQDTAVWNGATHLFEGNSSSWLQVIRYSKSL